MKIKTFFNQIRDLDNEVNLWLSNHTNIVIISHTNTYNSGMCYTQILYKESEIDKTLEFLNG